MHEGATPNSPRRANAAVAVAAAKAGRSPIAVRTATTTATWLMLLLLLCLLGCDHLRLPVARASPADLPSRAATWMRRFLNMGGLLGSPTSPHGKEGPYDRIMGHPVFQVTTSQGSSYLTMEKLNDVTDSSTAAADLLLDSDDVASGKASLSSDSNQYRTVAVYYMDPDDALSAHAELQQMEQMEKADLRITATSLARALKSASNLGQGLLTGQPVDALVGKVLSPKEGGSLRHKIMPPKRQLYYAARCHGRERIGFFNRGSDGEATSRDVAQAAVIGNSALTYRNLQRRQARRDRKVQTRARSALEAQYEHMDGQLGIPVFYARGMERRPPLLKGLASGNRRETPLFFNYEDLMAAWQKTRVAGGGRGGKGYLPAEPEVEVFNLWDVVTSMERDQDRQRRQQAGLPVTKRVVEAIAQPFRRRFAPLIIEEQQSQPLGLDSVTFVPSSDACTYKETITARGNGKARLRPMR